MADMTASTTFEREIMESSNSKYSTRIFAFILLFVAGLWSSVALANLAITNIVQSPQNNVPDDWEVTYTVTVAYTGAAGDSSNATVIILEDEFNLSNLFYSNDCTDGSTFDCGPVSSTSTFTFAWTPPGAGTYALDFDVICDPECEGESRRVTTIVGGLNSSPMAVAGPDLTITDYDNNGTESLTLNGMDSYDPDNDIVSYQWYEGSTLLASGISPTTSFGVGSHTVTLTVTDEAGNTGSDDVVITVNPGSPDSPIADAGPDQTVSDTNGDGLATVILDGSASYDPNNDIASFQWIEDDDSFIANGENPTIELPVGTHDITLYVMDQMENLSTDRVVITVEAGNSTATGTPSIEPISGENQRLSPNQLSEPLSVRAIGADGQPLPDTTITWTVTPSDAATLRNNSTTTNVDGESSNTVTPTSSRPGAVFKVIASMPDGTSARFLVNPIAGISGLTSSQRSAARALDNACPALQSLTRELTADEQGLLNTCDYLASASDSEITSALQDMLPDQIAAQGRNALSLARIRNKNILLRLDSLRAGAKGPSFDNINVSIQGKMLPSILVQQIGTAARGGGASADESEIASKLGFFVNGNLSFGETDTSDNEEGFDFETTGLTTGVDYRLTNQFVLGGALNILTTESDYENNSGTLDIDGYSLSVYGSYYQSEQLFVDGIFSVGKNRYDSGRNFMVGAVTHDLEGDTDSTEYSFSIGAGYDYFWQNLTFTPQARINYTRFEIDSYDESGSGLNLSIDSQDVESMAALVSGSLSMAYSTNYGVFIPYVSIELEHEFEDNSRAIVASFVNDPSQSTFSVETDDPDRDFIHLGLGFSATLQGGKSLFLHYENMLSHDDTEQYTVTGGYRQELQ